MHAKYSGPSDLKPISSEYLELKVIPYKIKMNPIDLRDNENSSEPHQYTVITLPSQQVALKSSGEKTLSASTAVPLGKVSTAAADGKVSLSAPLKLATTCQRLHYNYSSGIMNRRSTTDKTLPPKESRFVSIDEDSSNQLISPSSRWLSQPRSYRGAKRDITMQRKLIRKVPSFVDTTDGETSGMGSSVDEPIESSTESASETPSSFLQPRLSSRPLTISPSAFKQKKRGGWPKGRKRKPELPGTKPPKAPLTGYVLFLNERRKFYKETQQHLPFGEVTKLLGAEWSSMTGEQKAMYLNRSEQERRRYRNELQSYRQSHDYQLQLRKKRIKNVVIPRGATTTEESSDFTDEIDDDDSEELYCRTCDQWFSSLHNKREHLYGKHHLQAITSEYQREREAEEMRQAATSNRDSGVSPEGEEDLEVRPREVEEEAGSETLRQEPAAATTTATATATATATVESYPGYECLSSRESVGVASTTEDDHDDDDDDDEEEEDEEREYDGEEEEEEDGGGGPFPHLDAERVTDAAESVINKVLGREKEIRFLRRRHEKARLAHRKLSASLKVLQARQQKLQEQEARLAAEEEDLLTKARDLERMISVVRISGTAGDEEPSGVDEKILPESRGVEEHRRDALHLETLITGGGSEELTCLPVLHGSKDTFIENWARREKDYDPWIKSFFVDSSPQITPASREFEEDLQQTAREGENQNECGEPSPEAEEPHATNHQLERPLNLEEEHSYSRLSHPPNASWKKHRKKAILEPVMKKVVEEPAEYCDGATLCPLSRRASDDDMGNDIFLNETITQMAKNHLDEMVGPSQWDSLLELDEHLTETNLEDKSDVDCSRICTKAIIGCIISDGGRPSNSSNNLNCDTNSSSTGSCRRGNGEVDGSDFLSTIDTASTSSTDDQNDLSTFGLGDFIQEDVYFRQLNVPLDAGGFPELHSDLRSDLQWEVEPVISGRTRPYSSHFSHVPALDNIWEDDDLFSLLENDT